MAREEKTTHALLKITVGSNAPRLEDLLRERYTVGRSEATAADRPDFRIEGDEFVSRHHCTVLKNDKGWAVENASANGTLVNGKPVEASRALKTRDRIEIGEATQLEFLQLGAAERKRQFEALGATGATTTEKDEDKDERSFFQKPVAWVLIGFYAVIGLALLSLFNTEKEENLDPGSGPYFDALIDKPLEPATEMSEGRRQHALDLWERAKEQYGGDQLPLRGNRMRLAWEARKALEIFGYETVKDALAGGGGGDGEEIARTLDRVVRELESYISELYKQAWEAYERERYEESEEMYRKILVAVPDRDAKIHRFAQSMIQHIGSL